VPSLGPVTVRPVPDAALSAVASGCAGPGAAATEQVPPPAVPDAGFADAPVPGLTPQQQAALTRRLDRMFGSDKGDRVAATQELLADGDAFSDAVTLAVSRALRILQPSRVPMSDARASGVVNTLELLQQALPATLNRQRGEIEKLLQGARGIGADTAKRAEFLAARLQAAQDQRPRLYVRIAAVAQRAAVQAMLDSVPAGAFDVQPIEVRPGDPPARPELRAVGLSDRATARAEAAVRRLTLVGVAASPRQKKANNDIYVVWIDAGLCTTRQAPGCPEPPAASAAPESPPAAASAQPARASAPAVAVPPAAESPAAAPRTREQDAQSSFVAEVFSCASAPNRSGVTKGDSAEPPGAQALAVATTLKSMGFVVQRPAGSLNVTPTAPASVVVMGYPSHEATVNGVATALKAQGRAVQTVLTDIGKVAPSATAQQLKEAGYSLFGVEQRLLVVVCSAR